MNDLVAETRQKLIKVGNPTFVKLSDALINLEGGKQTPEGKAALRSFNDAIGRPLKYLNENFKGSNGRLANFIEAINDMADYINEQPEEAIKLYREGCNRNCDRLIQLIKYADVSRVVQFYKEVTCYTNKSGENLPEWGKAELFWQTHPRKATAEIDPYAGRHEVTAGLRQ